MALCQPWLSSTGLGGACASTSCDVTNVQPRPHEGRALELTQDTNRARLAGRSASPPGDPRNLEPLQSPYWGSATAARWLLG